MNGYMDDRAYIGQLFEELVITAGYTTNKALALEAYSYLGFKVNSTAARISSIKRGFLYHDTAKRAKSSTQRLTELSFFLLLINTPPNHEIIQKIIALDNRFADIHPIKSLNDRNLEEILIEINEKKAMT